MSRTDWLCEFCVKRGTPRVADVVDHIKPLAQGGEDEDENTRNLCHDCHDKVTREQFGLKKRNVIGPDGYPIGE
jgi:5-methylcytosine-specific restriction enzyme A